MVEFGTLIKELRVPGGHAKAFEMRKYQFLTIIDIEGQQVGDFVAFSKSDLKEKLSPVHTRTSLLTVKISVGDVLRSNYRNPMFKIVADTVGCHDILVAMCDEQRYLVDYGVKDHRSCMANFEEVLRTYGISREQFPDPFNTFQHTKIEPDGSLVQLPGLSRPGDCIVFQALMDVIGAVSGCPMDLNPIGGNKISDLILKISEGRNREVSMAVNAPANIHDLSELRERTEVFRDRIHAGQVLAGMLETFDKKDGIVLGIPAGGVPVAAEIAKKLGLPFDVAVVSKITLPWNTEAGYGAVAFDGTHRLNEEMLPQLRLSQKEIQTGIEKTKTKVFRRVVSLRGEKPFPELSQKKVIVVDDGLASGFTMLVAVETLSKADAEHIIVAVPTGHSGTVEKIATKVKALYCPNIRGGRRFAVADAYKNWSDVKNEEVSEIMKKF